MKVLQGKAVIVTGGSAGIGRAAALRFAEEGAQVLVTGRREAPLQELADSQPNIEYLIADAAKPEDAARVVDAATGRWGRLDILVNNAGAGKVMPLTQANTQDMADIFAVNVYGPSLLVRAALPWLKDAGGGSIINVSSTFGHKPTAMLSHYAASKAALEHLTRCWALELAADGIRINAVSSGPVNTDFMANQMHLSQEQIEIIKAQEQKNIPLGRRGNPEELAEWIVSLALPSSAWITGQVISVDGGLSIT